MQKRVSQLNRRNAPANRIEPGLPFSDEPNFIRYSTVSGTRPPVVGRETSLDPERTKRYDSSENHLLQYLKVLQKKTSDEQRRASVQIDGDASDISMASYSAPRNSTVSNRGLFLKSNVLKTSGPDPANKTASRPVAASVQTGRISSTLQKADAFSNKYKHAKGPPGNVNKIIASREQLSINTKHVDIHSKIQSESESANSSSEDFMFNVKDLIDLPSLSGTSVPSAPSEQSERDHESLPFQLQIAAESPETEDDISRSLNQSDPHTNLGYAFPAEGIEEEEVEAISDYEDDFEEESNHSRASSPTVEDSSISKSTESDGEVPENEVSIMEVSNEQGKSSFLESESEDTAFLNRKVVEAKTKVIPEVHSYRKTQNGINKETQTASVSVPDEATPRVIVVRNFPQVQPSFLSHLDEFSLHNPLFFELDEMTRQHLRTIRLFKDSQQKSYETLVTALKPNFQYTTWERTEKVLKKQRQKRRCRAKK